MTILSTPTRQNFKQRPYRRSPQALPQPLLGVCTRGHKPYTESKSLTGIPTDSTQLIPQRRRRKGRRGRRRRRERTRRRGVERKDAQAVESPAAPSSGGSSRVVLGLVSGHFRREQRLSDVLVVDLVLVFHVHVHHVTRKDVLVHGLLLEGGGGPDVVVLGLCGRRGGGRRKRK